MTIDDMLPSLEVCERARLSRDPRFDGRFFTAVVSTGIYCRPMCPAPAPKAENVSYYASAAAAEAAGYRPCLRCRPELAPGGGAWRRGDSRLARALKLIDEGVLAERPLAHLAERLSLSERQLRRLFVERLGATPSQVHGTRRLLFAKQLLTETRLPITEIALAAGFGSQRRFNAAFLDAYRIAPRELRGRSRAADGAATTLTLRLGYRPPYDFEAMLDFLRGRALPGIERVDASSYARVVGNLQQPGWLRVSAWPDGAHALRLELHGAATTKLLEIVTRLRRMFDLDADPYAIAEVLARDPRLAPLVERRPGLRLPSGWDGFEIAVRAVIGQRISVSAARTLTSRLVQRFGVALAEPFAPGLERLFPPPEALAEGDLDALGLTRARAAALRAMAAALLEGQVDFRVERSLEEFAARWVRLPGIGPWTAHYIALRGLGHPDALPAEDLIVQRSIAGPGARITAKALIARFEAIRPWRGYAVIQLWREAQLCAPAPARRAPRPRPSALGGSS
ncbi:AlkA N-terminal domain-containing protein [Halotalea alkalilenta]|uniref:DNA-3-methyladenine glycosylase II n=1 Tax=Halotalea alkalilenta TaxID=376489 RepID=A0A172YB24_9GAMM|nr:AlkA N-terminal domain-containing protein [Halotalea alkalilenta]ANF56312.1 DNA methylase [Halotalea alkalilenta]